MKVKNFLGFFLFLFPIRSLIFPLFVLRLNLKLVDDLERVDQQFMSFEGFIFFLLFCSVCCLLYVLGSGTSFSSFFCMQKVLFL